MATPSLNGLPNEVIQQILLFTPPTSTLALQQVSRRFNSLVQSLLWRYYCSTQYVHWDEKRCIRDKFSDPADEVDWKSIWRERQSIDRTVNKMINGILANQHDRLEKVQKIVEFGYDTKDTLLKHLRVGSDAEDVLARRYYSNAVLGCLHRTIAIKEWVKLRDGGDISLERALSAFDMFVLHADGSDFQTISSRLDDLARDINLQNPELEDQTPRQKAVAIATYLRSHDLTGVASEASYHNLQNSFIGVALQDEGHQSLPLISVAIFCCLAKRLDLSAVPCGYPWHVLAIVQPPQGHDLYGRPLEDGQEARSMYMDPFRSAEEVLVESLESQLKSMGVSPGDHPEYLNPLPVVDVAIRNARNIINSVQTAHQSALGRGARVRSPDLANAAVFPEMESAFYGALWASLMIGAYPHPDGPFGASRTRMRYLPYVLEHFEMHYPIDVPLIEQYLTPLFEFHGDGGESQLRETMRVMRVADKEPKHPKRRTKEISRHVHYKIGQVFGHKRYNYRAVITGWDSECSAGEHWMAQMRVDDLPKGRHQSFYHALVEDRSVRYVAEENIEIVTEATEALMELAGRHFKRWDAAACRFVSNIKDEYPDD